MSEKTAEMIQQTEHTSGNCIAGLLIWQHVGHFQPVCDFSQAHRNFIMYF